MRQSCCRPMLLSMLLKAGICEFGGQPATISFICERRILPFCLCGSQHDLRAATLHGFCRLICGHKSCRTHGRPSLAMTPDHLQPGTRRALLQEKGVTWRSHWGNVKPLIADDPRYAAMPRGDRDVYFRKYRDELEVRLVADQQRSCLTAGLQV